ncbi:hypothetical protein [Streptomyces sp. CB01635]|uniref:hypothetical protein n=1 Tax=Streptomyces sp. CB01635 TaxID=2020326 RepID=UPI0018FE0512
MSAKSNRSKADQDPSTWMPPLDGDWCEYITDWITVKVRWQLAIDPPEEAALAENSARCPNAPVTVTLARRQYWPAVSALLNGRRHAAGQ